MVALLGLIICFALYLLSKDKLYLFIFVGMLLSFAYEYTYESNLRRMAIFMYILYFLLYSNRNGKKKGEDKN